MKKAVVRGAGYVVRERTPGKKRSRMDTDEKGSGSWYGIRGKWSVKERREPNVELDRRIR